MNSIRSCCWRAVNDVKDYFKTMPTSLIQRKSFEQEVLSETQLDRCLNVFDLTFLGIGSTLGLGIYILAGTVASTESGPSIIISFLIAAIASVFAGLCYAEFGARVPRTGSAYVYSYVTVGEFIAFIIGWNLVLEYAIGTASVARGYSGYIDSLANNVMEKQLNVSMHIDIPHMAQYPDFLAFGITMLLAGVLSIGVSESSKFNNVFTIINLLVVIYVIICGSFKADIHNWQLKPSEIPPGHGSGGFFAFGIEKMLTGASTCFYGFVGFDCIATTGEEVKNPRRSIPIAIIASLLIVFFAYFGVSAIQTLMVPYWEQDTNAPLPDVFEHVGWKSAKYIISVGALAGLSTSLLGGMFPLPRVFYAMASDGLIFRFLAIVHPRFKTPMIATFLSGLLTGSLALVFNVNELAKMMSIGTLLAYTLVATSVLVLRYRDEAVVITDETSEDELSNPNMLTQVNSLSIVRSITVRNFLNQLFNKDRLFKPTPLSARVAVIFISFIATLIVVVDVILVFCFDEIKSLDPLVMSALVIVVALLFVAVTILYLQPIENKEISFKVPLVPFTPLLSIFINILLMLKLPLPTWQRFGIWMAIGFLIYFGYGIRNSSQRSMRYCLPSEHKDTEEFTEDTPIINSKQED